MSTEPLRLDSGRLCLDLLATLGDRREERLPDPPALDRWLLAAGLVRERVADTSALAAARALRAALFDLVDAQLRSGRPPRTAVDAVNDAAAVTAPPPRLAIERGALVARGGEVERADAALAAIARDAIDLLSGPERALLRECAAPDCSGVFVDTSRGGRRRWCSSARCGNRSRVAAHRARTATGA